jgi:hypothetical protein
VKVTDAVRPGATGMPEARADVALASLVTLGRTLLASKRADVRARIALYALTAAQLGEAEKVATETASVAGKAKSPKSAVQRADVDLWDGLNLAILEQVRRAFANASALDPTITTLGFVSLRTQAGAKGKRDPGGAAGTPGGDPAKDGGAAPTAGAAKKTCLSTG